MNRSFSHSIATSEVGAYDWPGASSFPGPFTRFYGKSWTGLGFISSERSGPESMLRLRATEPTNDSREFFCTSHFEPRLGCAEVILESQGILPSKTNNEQ